jgi:hypothetical protein
LQEKFPYLQLVNRDGRFFELLKLYPEVAIAVEDQPSKFTTEYDVHLMI